MNLYYLLLVATLCVHGNTMLLRGHFPLSIHEYDDYLTHGPVLGDILKSCGGTAPPLVMQGLVPLSVHEYLEELLYYTLAPSGRPLLGDIREPSDLGATLEEDTMPQHDTQSINPL
jgi:hypothetical protein